VVEIYWPHTRPFTHAGTLRQNQSGQAEIVKLIAAFRERTVGDATAPLSTARWAQPDRFEALIRAVEWKLIEMPLGRLQLIGNQYDPFIFKLGWDRMPNSQKSRQTSSTGACTWSRGPATIFCAAPVCFGRWCSARGHSRSLASTAPNKLSSTSSSSVPPGSRWHRSPQDFENSPTRCFYCQGVVASSGQIDQFVPWTRHVDNGIENLVYAHGTCNHDKSAYLASENHVERWVQRIADPAIRDQLRELADAKQWDSHAQQTLAVARSLYLKLPDGYKRWAAGKQFTTVDPARLRAALGAT
jgi:5-methylcytosine-specific restriction endonuclease McrA